MADTDRTLDTMIRNIEAKSGKTLDQLGKIVAGSELTRHSEIRSMLMEQFGLGHGQANAVVHLALKSDGQSAAEARNLSTADVLDEIYAGARADLRPIHDRVLKLLARLGAYETAPKKGYVSYRRKKQFATVGPRTRTQVEIGFAARQLPADGRLKEMPPNSMCRYTTRVSSPAEIDASVERWIRTSYDEAG